MNTGVYLVAEGSSITINNNKQWYSYTVKDKILFEANSIANTNIDTTVFRKANSSFYIKNIDLILYK
ncbi:hypothetical protein UFOVP49_50 [uncultured Caudovirales phage]|uniref:Uncharacterized protein n=1 Tax=uncultured Caudovirales phage TaxID=2100421 RepID=A0A6J5KTG9_9CAUD|nr:hypothetical protein UFOVP49_50 [uncultured Caudovirales phage]